MSNGKPLQDVELFAKDVYPEWVSYLEKAKKTITVITPFLDDCLVTLLRENQQVAAENIIVVTDLNVGNLLEHPNQLKALAEMLNLGYQIKAIRYLHAKVLIVDWQWVILGSQNFTNQGRKNKEVSVAVVPDVSSSEFLETLRSWVDISVTLSQEHIDKMQELVDKKVETHLSFMEGAASDFRSLLRDLHQDLARKELEHQAGEKGDGVEAFATLAEVPHSESPYETLLVEEGDLTHWHMRGVDGKNTNVDLERLDMIPILFADSLQMGFARVSRSRITYVRESVSWDDDQFMVCGMSLGIQVNFPRENLNKHNIEVTLTHPEGCWCRLYVLFDGQVAEVTGKRFQLNGALKKNHANFRKALEAAFLTDPHLFDRIFREYFAGVRLQVLGREDKNASSYFAAGIRYRLSLIQFDGNPVLLVRSV